MKSRKFGIGLLVMLAFVVTTGTFAYWASSVTSATDTAEATVTIGEGNEVTTTLVVSDLANTSALVPTDYGTPGVDDTVALSFPVSWTGAAAEGATGTMGITLDTYTLGTLSEAQIDAMFTFTLTGDGDTITVGTPTNVTVTIVFGTEPASQAIYNQVANGTLTLNLTFTVTPTP